MTKHDLLKEYTNMTEREVQQQVNAGFNIYENSDEGKRAYIADMVSALWDAEADADIIEHGWESLDVLGGFRVDYML